MSLCRCISLVILLSSAVAFAQQRDCCWCKSPQGQTFGVEVPAGFGSWQCRTACSSSYGTAVGFKHGACYAPPTPPPVVNDCPIQTVGGDCKGNNWCQCHAMSVNLSAKELNLDDTLTVSVGTGDLGSGKPLVDPGGGSVDWGDGTNPSAFPKLENGSYNHKYAREGPHSLTVKETGQFKWSADDGSCSYYCRAEKHESVVVRPKSLTTEQLTSLLKADKSAQAKKDLARQEKVLQQEKK
jgi:hypothetical protein